MKIFIFLFLFLWIPLTQAEETSPSNCDFYIQHHFVQQSDVNKALAYDIDSVLTSWKDEHPLTPKIEAPPKKNSKKKRAQAKLCSSRRFIAAEPSALKGKWAHAGSTVLYMITWLNPQKPNQKRLQFELFVNDKPTPRRIWVEGPSDYSIPEAAIESKKQWVNDIAQAIIARSLSQAR